MYILFKGGSLLAKVIYEPPFGKH